MADKTMRRFGSAPRTLAATPLAAALLVLSCAMPAEAGWLARGTGVAGAGHALKENLGDLLDHFSEMSDAVISGDDAKAADVWAKVKGTPGRIIKDAFPVLKLGDAALAAKERAKDRLKSAERKIGRFVRRTGEAAADVRAALAIRKSGREKIDPWSAAPTAAARSPDPWSATGGGGAGSAALPAESGGYRAALGALETREAERREANQECRFTRDLCERMARADDPATGSGDYRAALGALETREAERREAERVAAARREAERQEAERREAERVAAARREAERQEAERREAERRERRRAEEAEREAEYAQRQQEQFADTLQQSLDIGLDMLQQSLDAYGASQSGGYHSDNSCGRYACE